MVMFQKITRENVLRKQWALSSCDLTGNNLGTGKNGDGLCDVGQITSPLCAQVPLVSGAVTVAHARWGQVEMNGVSTESWAVSALSVYETWASPGLTEFS